MLFGSSDLLDRTPPAADHRLPYGPGDFHFGDLRLPTLAPGKLAPVLVFLHGGWWKAEYGLDYGGHLCAALKAAGIVTWSLEYRRVGNPGGGFPGTLEDVAAGYDFLETLARTYPLDLHRVIVSGHSAGGQLAFWLAGRPHLPETGPFAALRGAGPPSTARPRAVIAFAGAVDLHLVIDLSGWFTFAHDKQQVLNFIGASPAQAPDRYRVANPGDLLPLNVPQILIQGTADDQIPPGLPQRWAERSRRNGELVTLDIIPGADHFDIVDPRSKAWPRVLAAIQHAFA